MIREKRFFAPTDATVTPCFPSCGIQKATGLPDGIALAGLNVQGLSCDLHALLNSSYPRPSSTSKDLSLYAFCNWALANFGSAAEVRAALEAEQVVS